jgi:hypothetical protein
LAQETLVKTGKWVDPDVIIQAKPVPTLRWYVERAWWPNRRLELSTRATYDQMLRLYLLPRFGDTLLPDIVRSDVQTWLTSLRDDKKLALVTHPWVVSGGGAAGERWAHAAEVEHREGDECFG